MPKQTEEQQKESQERREAFIKGYGELREKYQHDFMSVPTYVPNDKGTFETSLNLELVDLKQLAVKSPIVVNQ